MGKDPYDNYVSRHRADWRPLLGPVALEVGGNGWEMIHCAYCGMYQVMPTEYEKARFVTYHGEEQGLWLTTAQPTA